MQSAEKYKKKGLTPRTPPEIRGRFYRHQAEQLEQMILDHIAQRARAFVVAGATLHPQRLGRGDLHMVDITRVPEGLENRVRETQHHDVLRGFFPEEMVDPVGVGFGEGRAHDPVQFPRRSEVSSEWFFDDDARPPASWRLMQTRGLQMLKDRFELIRCDRQIEETVSARPAFLLDLPQALTEGSITLGVSKFALVIGNRFGEAIPQFVAHILSRMFARRFSQLSTKGLIRLLAPGHPDNGYFRRQFPIGRDVIKRGNELAMRQITRCSEDDDRARLRHAPRHDPFP